MRASASSKSSSGSSGRASAATAATTRRGSANQVLTSVMGDTADQPGALAILLAAVFAVISALYLIVLYKVDVDDRGDPVPLAGSKGFRGLYLATREALTGDRVVPDKVSAIDGVGPVWLVLVCIPLVVAIGAFVMFRWRRREQMYWPVTIAMLLTAGTVLLLAMVFFIPTMAALTVASFQIRKSELPQQMARREQARADAEARAAAAADDDEDEYEDDDEDVDDAYDDVESAYDDEDDEYESGDDDEDDEYESGDDDVYEDDEADEDEDEDVEAELEDEVDDDADSDDVVDEVDSGDDDAEDDAIVIVEAEVDEADEPEVDSDDDEILSQLEDDIARDEAAEADDTEVDDTEGKPSTK